MGESPVALAITGGVLGLATAYGVSRGFTFMRGERPMALAIIGYLCGAILLFMATTSGLAYLTMRGDPLASMGPVWGMLSLSLFFLLFLCALIALKQKRVLKIAWIKAFGGLLSTTGAALLIGMLAQNSLYAIAEALRNGSRDIPRILESFGQARTLLGFFDLALLLTLLVLETFDPFHFQHQCVQTEQGDDTAALGESATESPV